MIIEDKKQRILKASVQEFAKNGYEQSSTNNIIKEAKTSKGLLFHYFQNKKTLYLETVEYCLEQYSKYFKQHMQELNPDIFERAIEIGQLKLKLFYEDPEMYLLMMDALSDPPKELKAEINKRYETILAESTHLFFTNIDTSPLREDLDQNKALEVVFLTLEALSNRYMKTYKNHEDKGLADLPRVMKEMEEYLEMMKYGVYKR